MNIDVVNTGFGDCNILSSKSKCLIVDYGSLSPKTDLNFSTFTRSLMDEKIGLVSHFHEDHINGFNHYFSNGGRFNHFILPDMFPVNISGKTLLERMIILSLFGSRRSYTFHATQEALDLIDNIINSKTRVQFVSRGDYIDFDRKKQFEVLWPPRENDYLDSFCSSLFDTLFGILNNLGVMEIYRSIIENLILFREGNVVLGRNASLIHGFNKLRGIVQTFQSSLKNEYDSIVSKAITLTNSDINKYSIVFHEPERILMTGDVTKNVLDVEIYSDLSSKYSVIKAPHHGTNRQKYVPNNLPKTDNLIINNGGTSYLRRKISKDYFDYNLKGVITNVYCTNESLLRRCECRNYGSICSSNICYFNKSSLKV